MEKIRIAKMHDPVVLIEIGMKSGNKFEMWFREFSIQKEEKTISWQTPVQNQRPLQLDFDSVEYVILKDVKNFGDLYDVDTEIIKEAQAQAQAAKQEEK